MRGLGRIGSGIVAAGTTAAVIAALGITSSQAAWTDQEFDNATLGALDCTPGESENFDTTAWGRVLSAQLLGIQLDGIAALNGQDVDNVGTGDTSTSNGVNPTDLGDNAWANQIDLSLLSSINASIGANVFSSPDVGVYTEYGQAWASGSSTGASGLITTSEGGVALGSTDSDPPGIGTIDLSDTLAEVIGDELGTAAGNLADLQLGVGAVASLASVDACMPDWTGDDIQDYLTRDYLIASLQASFQSALIGALVSDIAALVNTLDDDLDVDVDLGTQLELDLADALDALLGGIDLLDVGLDSGVDVSASLNVDLSDVSDLLTGTIPATGPVQINLADGTITLDLDTLVGGLNNLPPNTNILTPEVIDAILAAIDDAVGALVNDVLDAVQDAIDAATISVDITTTLALSTGLGSVAGVDLAINLTGPLVGGPLVATVEVSGSGPVIELLDAILFLIGGTDVVFALIEGVIEGGVSASVITPVQAAITANLTTLLDQLQLLVTALSTDLIGTGGLVPSLLTDLTGVFDLLASILQITVNVQPDQSPFPNAPIPPDVPESGRYFVSAIRIGALNLQEDSLLSLYLASSSVGPNTPR